MVRHIRHQPGIGNGNGNGNAMIFPGMTIVKILFVNLIRVLLI